MPSGKMPSKNLAYFVIFPFCSFFVHYFYDPIIISRYGLAVSPVNTEERNSIRITLLYMQKHVLYMQKSGVYQIFQLYWKGLLLNPLSPERTLEEENEAS